MPIAAAGGSPGPIAGSGPSTPSVDPSCASVPIGFWTFDDCNTFRTDLQDTSFQGHTAFRSVDVACTKGQEGQAVTLAAKDDLVYTPDQPDFALNLGVTVAAWVKPTSVDKVQTIFRKRDDANSAIALVINHREFQFVVRLASGKLVSVSAPASAGKWTHVAATYDGAHLRLYVNGTLASSARAAGVIARGVGPLLIGNDAAGRRFDGTIDSAWFNTMAAPAQKILELTCIQQDPLVSVAPRVGPAVPAGTKVPYTLSIKSRNQNKCAPQSFVVIANAPDSGFTIDPGFSFINLGAGDTTELVNTVASGDETEGGTYTINFQVISQSNGGFFPPPIATPSFPSATSITTSSNGVTVVTSTGSTGSASVVGPTPMGTATGQVSVDAQYVVVEPTGCHVSSQRELFVRDLSVVEDPARTTFIPGDAKAGAWSFGRLMERLSPTAADAPAVTEAMFRTFLSPQVINSFTIEPRPPMDPVVLQPWPRTASGELDLARAPLRLLAIIHRIDLKDLSKGKAGEGRFVFGVLDAQGNPMEFTVIFEYALPATTDDEARVWADRIHALQALKFPSAEYNQALQALTDAFSGKDVLPGAPNGSALIDIRTNEIALSDRGVWQLREFHISPTTGFMEPATLFQTPDFSFNGTAELARFINANEAAILNETHTAPERFEDVPFQTGAVFNNIDVWTAPGINNPEARHKFSLNTCNGCHGGETQTAFLQVNPRSVGQVSSLSGFLTGETVQDPFTGATRRLSELKRRRTLLESVVCATPQP